MYEMLKSLGEQLVRRAPNCKNEEATKQALILPFILALGYDIYDPTVVLPEYRADFAKKSQEKVDYAILFGTTPSIFVEAKPYGAPLEDHDGQLARYFNSTLSARLGIITDGIRYRFFTDVHNANIMDSEPFLTFNFESFSEKDATLLACFTRGSFDPSKTTTLAEDIIYTEKVQKKVSNLLQCPTEDFIRFILGDVFPGRVTSKTIERFTPVVQKALQNPLVTEYDDIEITIEDLPQRSGIVTTQEELDFFAFVASVVGQPLQHKDTINYFSILKSGGKGFLRAAFTPRSKSLGCDLHIEEVQALLPGFKVVAGPRMLGISRVYLTGPTNDPALVPLLLETYKRG
jgi:hypothetical protein